MPLIATGNDATLNDIKTSPSAMVIIGTQETRAIELSVYTAAD
jgi:hypothetical protein